MCLEDLRLARGREIGQIVTASDNVTGAQLLPSNPNRVALLISWTTPAAGSLLALSLDQARSKILIQFNDAFQVPTTLRIEDIGQALTSQIFSGGNGAAGAMSVVEIISYVNAAPFARIEDRNKV